MSPIDKSINLIGDILNCASLHFVHIETKNSFLRVIYSIRQAKQKIARNHKPFLKVDFSKIKEEEREM